jgi:hypothetical protein
MPNKPNVLLPALYGGIIMGVVSAVPGLSILNCFCCAGIMLGGFMAVFFYKKDLTSAMPPLSSADGVKLGALSGLFGAVITIILGKMIYALMGGVESEMILNMLDSVGVKGSLPPEALSQLEQGGDPIGFFQIVSNFILCPVFGLLGGLIGYSVLKGKQAPPAPPPPAPAPM